MDRPNVLLIVLDTARADAFEPYGAAPATTPNIAELAARGHAIQTVHSTACWTMPSHASMFTGQMPRTVGLSQAPNEVPPSCRPVIEGLAEIFLPEVLRQSGFRTRGVSANVWVSNISGFGTGFDEFRDVPSNRAAQMVSQRRWPRARWELDAVRARSDDGAAAAGAMLRGWFRERTEQPNFWFVNLMECHSPYLPPKPWNDLGPLDRLRSAREARRHLTLMEIWRVCVAEFDVPADALTRMRHLYDCSIRQLDSWVGDTLTALDDAGQLDDTLVLVCSDHGENLGEGGLLGHAYSLDERLTNVPFIAAGPNAPTDMVSLTEVPRVIADAVGLDHHPWSRDAAEVAVAQFDSPGTQDDPRKIKAIELWGAGPETLVNLSTRIDAAVRNGSKLVRRQNPVQTDLQLFNLVDDPLEERPLRVTREEAPADLLTAIEDQPATPITTPAADPGVPSASPEELARIEEQMRTLGYL